MFTGWSWPLPAADAPGEWAQADGPVGLCTNGIHASSVDQLPQWLGDELWEVQLDGEVLREEPALVAARARLVRRVTEWDTDARLAFCRDCAGRGRELADGYPDAADVFAVKIAPFTELALAAPVGYWTALLAGESASGARTGPEYEVAFTRERAAQARWLRDELGLTD